MNGGSLINARASSRRTAAYVAAHDGRAAAVRRLAALGANLGIQDVGGRTPLWIAAFNAHTEVVAALIELGK